MNLLLRELRAHLKSMIGWSIGIFLMVAGGMGKYAALTQSGEPLEKLFDTMPEPMKIVMGIGAFDLNTARGFYGLLYLYLILMAAIHATLLGTEILSKEERDHTSEFLLVKPMKRSAIITSKLAAGLLNILAFNLITFVFSVLMYASVSNGESMGAELSLLMFGMFLLQLIFYALGFAFSASSKFSKTAGPITSAIMFATFFLSFVVDINTDLDFLKYLSPFKYFDAKVLLNNQGIEPLYLLLTTIIVATSVIMSYRLYQRRDINH